RGVCWVGCAGASLQGGEYSSALLPGLGINSRCTRSHLSQASFVPGTATCARASATTRRCEGILMGLFTHWQLILGQLTSLTASPCSTSRATTSTTQDATRSGSWKSHLTHQ